MFDPFVIFCCFLAGPHLPAVRKQACKGEGRDSSRHIVTSRVTTAEKFGGNQNFHATALQMRVVGGEIFRINRTVETSLDLLRDRLNRNKLTHVTAWQSFFIVRGITSDVTDPCRSVRSTLPKEAGAQQGRDITCVY